MSRRNEVLYRDANDSMIGGVCSGLAHYFDVDTTLVRVIFVVLTMAGGGGLLGYLILWLVLDPAPTEHWTNTADDSSDTETNPASTNDRVETVDNQPPEGASSP